MNAACVARHDHKTWIERLVHLSFEDFPAVLPILLDVARRPAFPESEIEQPRAETITALRQDDDNPAVRAVDSVAG